MCDVLYPVRRASATASSGSAELGGRQEERGQGFGDQWPSGSRDALWLLSLCFWSPGLGRQEGRRRFSVCGNSVAVSN